MSDGTAIEWTDATWNPVTGCSKVSEGCRNCLAPDSRVLMLDGSWVPIGELAIGDCVLGYLEAGGLGANRTLLPSEVQAVWRTTAPTIEIRTASGRRVVCSEDHLWLSRIRPSFRRADALTLATRLRAMGNPDLAADLSDPDYQAGYVAGVTAGDGTMRWDPTWRSDKKGYPQSYWRIAVLASDQSILDRLVSYLSNAGVDACVRPFGQAAISKDVLGKTIKLEPKAMLKVEVRSLQGLPVIARLLDERPSTSWKAGWLAGFLDTDGSSDGKSLRWSQKKSNDYLQRVVRYVGDLGFTAKVEPHYGERATSARLYVHNLHERVSFVGSIRPALPRKCIEPYLGTLFTAEDDPVVSVSRGPVRELVDITTSTHTFIAEGLATHNCYAEALSLRFGMSRKPWSAANAADNVVLHPRRLSQPVAWREPRRIFVNSMSDLFHEVVPDEYIRRVFEVMDQADHHTYQVLTKRPRRMYQFVRGLGGAVRPHIWLGTSVEDQRAAVARIPWLVQTPAAVRFLSCEPLLGPVDLRAWLDGDPDDPDASAALHWVIVGGESGPHYRPLDLAWAADLRDQCVEAGVAYFFKQVGGRTPKAGGRTLDGRTWDEFPVVQGRRPLARTGG